MKLKKMTFKTATGFRRAAIPRGSTANKFLPNSVISNAASAGVAATDAGSAERCTPIFGITSTRSMNAKSGHTLDLQEKTRC